MSGRGQGGKGLGRGPTHVTIVERLLMSDKWNEEDNAENNEERINDARYEFLKRLMLGPDRILSREDIDRVKRLVHVQNIPGGYSVLQTESDERKNEQQQACL